MRTRCGSIVSFPQNVRTNKITQMYTHLCTKHTIETTSHVTKDKSIQGFQIIWIHQSSHERSLLSYYGFKFQASTYFNSLTLLCFIATIVVDFFGKYFLYFFVNKSYTCKFGHHIQKILPYSRKHTCLVFRFIGGQIYRYISLLANKIRFSSSDIYRHHPETWLC